MPKVNINGSHHQVEVEHDGELAYVVKVAEKLWRRTSKIKRKAAGPAFGFVAEQRSTGDLYGMDADGR